MFTRKFKKFFKKAKENSKKKNFSKAKSSDREQFSGCFKCGKHDHIVKNCPLLKAMLAVWGDTTEDDEASKEEETAVALIASSESESNDEPLDSLA